MDDQKLTKLAKELQQCKSDCLANAAEIDSLKAQLMAIRERLAVSIARIEENLDWLCSKHGKFESDRP